MFIITSRNKNAELLKEVKRATEMGGFFITITTLEGTELKHSVRTSNFKLNDIIPACEEIRHLAEGIIMKENANKHLEELKQQKYGKEN